MELIDKEMTCTLKFNQGEIERILWWFNNLKNDYEYGRVSLGIEDTYLYNSIKEATGIKPEVEY